jgi:predicted nucleotidyltransferase
MNTCRLSTSDPEIASVLGSIREAIVTVAGSSLVGLYLFGSLATGDFDATVSDIDLLAVLADAPGEQLVARLHQMQADLAQANPTWDDRSKLSTSPCRAWRPAEPAHRPSPSSARVHPSRSYGPGQTGSSAGTRPVRTGSGYLGRHRLAGPADPQRRVYRGATAVSGGVHQPGP